MILCILGLALDSQAQESMRPATHAITLQVGQGRMRDTYLTPLLYKGTDIGLRWERARQLRHPLLSNLQHIDIDLMTGEDKGQHSESWVGRIKYDYALHWDIHPIKGQPQANSWMLRAGVCADAALGFDYNLKLANANNPVSVRACANIGISAMAVYYYGQKRHHSLMLQVQAPILGVALMPEYGASYYETFYLGHGGNYINFTSVHNQQDLDVRLTTDLQYTKFPIRLGLAYRIETMNIHDITQRYSTLHLVAGIVFSTLPFSRRQAERDYHIDHYRMIY